MKHLNSVLAMSFENNAISADVTTLKQFWARVSMYLSVIRTLDPSSGGCDWRAQGPPPACSWYEPHSALGLKSLLRTMENGSCRRVQPERR